MPSMRRFVFTTPLQPDALETRLPPHTQRLVLCLHAPQPGRITRAESTALWRALREQEKTHPLKYHLALNSGQVNTGEPTCWLGLTTTSNASLLEAARIFDALLRQHVPLFANEVTGPPASIDTAPLLHDLERRQGWRVAFTHGELDLLREQLKSIPADALTPFPRLRLARIWLMCKDARIHEAEKEWGQFRLALTRGRYPQIPAWEAGLVRELVAIHTESPVTAARHTYLEQLVQQIPLGDADAIGIAHHCLWYLAFESGDLPRALVAADTAALAYTRARSRYGSVFIHYHHGITQATAGQFASARRSYRKGCVLSRRHTSLTCEQPATGQALLAGLDYVMNQTRRAAAALASSLAPIEQGESWSHLLWLVYRTHIQLAALEHDPAALEQALRHTRRVARSRGFKRLETRLDLLEIELDLRCANPEAARQHARRLHLTTLAQRPLERDLGWQQTILQARWLWLLLRLPQAKPADLQQVQILIEEGRRLQDMELRVRAGLLRAQMELQLGEHEAALTALDEVLTLLLPERPMRLLLDHPGIGSLLAQYRRAARSRQIARQLGAWLDELERAARHDARQARSHAHRISLTTRELEVLHELAQGRRDKEIAQRLSCSEHTVKFHLKRMNSKFSTHKRGELLAATRKAGLLE